MPADTPTTEKSAFRGTLKPGHPWSTTGPVQPHRLGFDPPRPAPCLSTQASARKLSCELYNLTCDKLVRT